MREFGDHIGAGRRDHDVRGPAREFDMAHRRFGRRIPQRAAYRVARQRLERRRADELRSGLGQHHAHVGLRIAQPAHEFGGLVRGDAATDPKQDAFTGQVPARV